MVKNLAKRHIAHLGAIIFNYSIVGFIITMALAIGVVAYPFLAIISMAALVFYYFILVIGAILTIGTVLLSAEYRALFNGPVAKFLMNVGEAADVVVDKMTNLIPIIGMITGGLIVISVGLLLVDRKWEKSKSRLITASVLFAILSIVVALTMFGVLAMLGGAK